MLARTSLTLGSGCPGGPSSTRYATPPAALSFCSSAALVMALVQPGGTTVLNVPALIADAVGGAGLGEVSPLPHAGSAQQRRHRANRQRTRIRERPHRGGGTDAASLGRGVAPPCLVRTRPPDSARHNRVVTQLTVGRVGPTEAGALAR